MDQKHEICRAAFPDSPEPRISYGLPFAESVRKHIEEEFKASRIYLIVSHTLAYQTSAWKQLQDSLGERIAGSRVGLKPHTSIAECLEVTRECEALHVDCIVTLGGSSYSDAAKLIAMALGNKVNSLDDMMALPFNGKRAEPHIKKPKFRFISIPTTLSGGEYSDYSGATKDDDQMKIQFSAPLKGPSLVVLDPSLALLTPQRLWLASGFRGIDHGVEILCGLEADPICDAAASKALELLIPALLKTKTDPSDIRARLDAQLGINFALTNLRYDIYPGASHGIGHNLGPLGVSHGETSCILLSKVCKYNAMKGANNERQAKVKDLLWSIPQAKALFDGMGLDSTQNDLGDLLDTIVKTLGLPTSLKEVGVGKDRFVQLAINSLPDLCVMNNPAPLETADSILEILQMCA